MKKKDEAYIKASRKGSREAELELTGNGWMSKSSIHKSNKNYKRTTKHKNKNI